MESKWKGGIKRVLRKAGVMKRHPSQVLAPKDCPRFDCSRVAWQPDNHLVYHRRLLHGSVQYDPHLECWVILGYDDVLEVLKNDGLFSNAYTAEFDEFLGGSDGEAHKRFRRSMRSSVVVDRQEAKEFVDKWMDRFIMGRRSFDSVADFGVLLPREFTSHLLGMEAHEAAKVVSRLAKRRTDIDSCLMSVTKVLNQIVEEVRSSPRRGVIGELVHSKTHEGLTDHQIVSVVRHLWFAGTVTLSTVLPACMMWLSRDPRLADRLRSHPESIPNFISEVMRLESPTQFIQRKCMADIEFGGRKFLKGAMVRPCLASANRDPSTYPEPDCLRLDRPPHRHLAFGYGEHVCLGAMQARTIAETSIHRILQASTSIRSQTPEHEIEYEKSLLFRALKTYKVVLE